MNSKAQGSQRAKNHDKLLQQALKRPGVREVMQVYGASQKAHAAANAYRAVIEGIRGKTTNHTNSL